MITSFACIFVQNCDEKQDKNRSFRGRHSFSGVLDMLCSQPLCNLTRFTDPKNLTRPGKGGKSWPAAENAQPRHFWKGGSAMQNTLKKFIQWQPVGQRILKTSLVVTLCLFFYMLRGYEGASMPAESITYSTDWFCSPSLRKK